MLPIAVTEVSLTGQQDQSDPKQLGKRISSGTGKNTELLRTENVELVN
jgi:hypothetical protein